MNSRQYFAIKQQFDVVLNYLDGYLPLANCHMVDYFTKNWFSKHLPEGMEEEINKIGCKETMNLLLNSHSDNERQIPKIWSFVNKCQNLALYNCKEVCITLEELEEKLNNLGGSNKDRLKLEVFMTEKKSHEVEVLSSIAATIYDVVKSSHVIDIGDGKGYLSSMLAFEYKCPVLGVDAKLINTESASKRAEKLGKLWPGIQNKPKRSILPKSEEERIKLDSNLLYKQVTQFVTAETNFPKLIKDIFLQEGKDLSLVGLHTCGNLAADSLKIFCQNKDIKAVCNVSCCYHLLTEKSENEQEPEFGFPMSDYALKKNVKLGRAARMLSAQSIDRILHHKDVTNKIMFYRAILQVVLENYCIELPTRNVGKARKEFNTFSEYAEFALKKLQINLINVSNEELDNVFDLYSKRDYEMYVFSLIRVMLAPVIESALLLDRLLYLHEQGFENSFLVKLFDPVISPRCYGIISLKQ